MFFQDGLTGSAWGDWANYTDSPLRAFDARMRDMELACRGAEFVFFFFVCVFFVKFFGVSPEMSQGLLDFVNYATLPRA